MTAGATLGATGVNEYLGASIMDTAPLCITTLFLYTPILLYKLPLGRKAKLSCHLPVIMHDHDTAACQHTGKPATGGNSHGALHSCGAPGVA